MDEATRASVLPHDRVAERLACRAVPDDGRLALVRDADRGHVARLAPGRRQRTAYDLARSPPHLARVVLDPSGARRDLLVLALIHLHDAAVAIEQDEARARRALVDRSDVLGHVPRNYHLSGTADPRPRCRLRECASPRPPSRP